MGEGRRFKVGDLVDAKELDYGVLRKQITDGVIAEVRNPGDTVPGTSVRMSPYYVVHACNPEWGHVFEEEEVKPRSADDAWRAGHFFLHDLVVADDGITSFKGVVEKFMADGDRPYKVNDPVTKQSGFFGDAHLALEHRNRDRPGERLQIGDWVVADDGEVRFEDAVIGRTPPDKGGIGGLHPGWHYVYAADGSGDVRAYSEERLRPRSTPVFPDLRDPEGRDPDWQWAYFAPRRARHEAFQESRRQAAEAKVEVEILPKESSLFKHLYGEPPKRPIVSGFRGVLMWIAAVPVASLAAESLAPGTGQTVSLILVVSSAVAVPWIARRIPD
jgi:hypothetical protein